MKSQYHVVPGPSKSEVKMSAIFDKDYRKFSKIFLLVQFEYHYEFTTSKSHQISTVKNIKKHTSSDFIEELFESPTILSGETVR